MPIYEYRCKNCGTIFEEQNKIDDRNVIQTCPKCSKREGFRIISISMFDTGGTNEQKLSRLDGNLKYKKNHY